MFIISLTYTDIAGVDARLGAHRDYLKEQYGRGAFLMSGRKVPRTGGIVIAACESREEVEALIELDPFKEAGVATYEITEFVPTMTSDALAGFCEE